MKSKLLQQTKVITDGTTAFSRLSADSCIIIVSGGTADADIKLQSGDSTSQSDFITLGKSGGSNTYKVFEVDLRGCGDYIKVTGTSLTEVIVVLGDFTIDPPTTNAVIR